MTTYTFHRLMTCCGANVELESLMRFARACLCLVLYLTLALVRCFLASCARTSTFRYNFVLPLLQQVRSHCKRSRIAVGSCSILYKNIRETIKASYCSKKGCPAEGFIDFPLILQDVIDVEIDHQNYSIDFSDLDIKTACKKYKIHGEACVRFENEINEYQNYVYVHKKEYEVQMINEYAELKGNQLRAFFKNKRFLVKFSVCHGISNQRLSLMAALSLVAEITEFIQADLESNIKILLPDFLGYYIYNHGDNCTNNSIDCIEWQNSTKNVKPEDLFDIPYLKVFLQSALNLHIVTASDFVNYTPEGLGNGEGKNQQDLIFNMMAHPTLKWNDPLSLIKLFENILQDQSSDFGGVRVLNFGCMLQKYGWHSKRQLEYRQIIFKALRPSSNLNYFVEIIVSEIKKVMNQMKIDLHGGVNAVAIHVREKNHWLGHCRDHFSSEKGFEGNDCYLSIIDVRKKLQFLGHLQSHNTIIYIASGDQDISLVDLELSYSKVITKDMVFKSLVDTMPLEQHTKLLLWLKKAPPMVRAQLDYFVCVNSIFRYFYGNYYSSMSHTVKEDRIYRGLSSFYLNGRNDGIELGWFERDFQ